MEWDTDFKVSTTVITAIFEVELNVSEFYDLNCAPDGGATGITGTFTFGHVPIGEYWVGLNVADDTGLYNTTKKQITVTGAPNVATGVNRAKLSGCQPPGGRYSDSDASRHGCTHPVCYVPPAWAGSQKKVGGHEPSL